MRGQVVKVIGLTQNNMHHHKLLSPYPPQVLKHPDTYQRLGVLSINSLYMLEFSSLNRFCSPDIVEKNAVSDDNHP